MKAYDLSKYQGMFAVMQKIRKGKDYDFTVIDVVDDKAEADDLAKKNPERRVRQISTPSDLILIKPWAIKQEELRGKNKDKEHEDPLAMAQLEQFENGWKEHREPNWELNSDVPSADPNGEWTIVADPKGDRARRAPKGTSSLVN